MLKVNLWELLEEEFYRRDAFPDVQLTASLPLLPQSPLLV